VAASFYLSITGQAPLEAIDRMVEDDLISPSKMGVTIESNQEKALLKALSVQICNRYQVVDDFQEDLIATIKKNFSREGFAGVKPKLSTGSEKREGFAGIRPKKPTIDFKVDAKNNE
jgi:hypothetical protein